MSITTTSITTTSITIASPGGISAEPRRDRNQPIDGHERGAASSPGANQHFYRVINRATGEAMLDRGLGPVPAHVPHRSMVTWPFHGTEFIVRRVGDLFRLRHRETGGLLTPVSSDPVQAENESIHAIAQTNEPNIWMTPEAEVEDATGFRVQHVGTGRYLEAAGPANEGVVALGSSERRDTQVWSWKPAVLGAVQLRHEVTGRFLDARPIGTQEVNTRPDQDNPSQWWDTEFVGAAYEFTDRTTVRVDAQETQPFRVVTRTRQNNSSQYWAALPSIDGSYTFQQVRTGRYLSSSETGEFDEMFTVEAVTSDRQRWILR